MLCLQGTFVTFYSDAGEPTRFPASIAGTDPSGDLAVLSIDAPAALLRPVRVGSSADLRTGQMVFAIGNPSGLSRTQTCGVVSGLNRAIPSPTGVRIAGAIQTDAPINAGAHGSRSCEPAMRARRAAANDRALRCAGNSGGPLLDSAGRVIGVNTATFSRQGSGRGSGVNFALPIDKVRTVVPRLIITGQAGEKRV